MEFDELSRNVIGCALEVHRQLGPGLLESTYQKCLACELSQANIPFQMEVALPVRYKEVLLDCGYRIDLLVGGDLILEIKSVESLLPIHQAQILTYMRLQEFLWACSSILMSQDCRTASNGSSCNPSCASWFDYKRALNGCNDTILTTKNTKDTNMEFRQLSRNVIECALGALSARTGPA